MVGVELVTDRTSKTPAREETSLAFERMKGIAFTFIMTDIFCPALTLIRLLVHVVVRCYINLINI
jgi:hypothetical protein